MKSESSNVVINAFERLFESSHRSPKKLWTDQGSEFINHNFKTFLKDNNIELYHVYNEGEANVIERWNRTLGEMIQMHMTTNETSNIEPSTAINKFKVGDRVRITKYKKHFEKGYTPKWSREIFVVD